jgi:hypothetical protein
MLTARQIADWNSGVLKLQQFTDTNGDQYDAWAYPQTALTDARWMVRKTAVTTGVQTWAGGDQLLSYPANTLATVKALTYS